SIKGFLQIHLGAGALITGHAARHYLIDNTVATPTRSQLLRAHLPIAFVVGMHRPTSFIKLRHPHGIKLPTGLPDTQCIASPRSRPVPHPLELNTPDNALHLGHPPVGAKAVMQPAKARRVVTLIYCIPRFAMILVRPHTLPQLTIIGRDHAPFTPSGHDLVLAEGPGSNMTDRADRAPLVPGTMGLGTVLDHKQIMLAGQFHDRVHITGPTSQMHTDDGLGALSQHRPNGVGSHVLRIRIHISKYRHSAGGHNAGGRSQEGTRGNNNLIACANVQRFKHQIQRNSTVGQSNGIFGIRPGSKLLLELPALLASPVVDLVGKQNITRSVGLFLGEGRPGGKRGVKHEIPSEDNENHYPTRAGTPTATQSSGIFETTTAPAPTVTPLPISTNCFTEAPMPTQLRSPTQTPPAKRAPGLICTASSNTQS